MEIEYQNTKKDFREFYKSFQKNGLQKRTGVIILLITLSAFAFGGKPFEWEKFVIGTTVSIVIIFGIYYFIPLLVALARLNKLLEKDQSFLDGKKLSVVEQGLLIESESKNTTLNWESIVSAHSINKFVYFKLVNKKILFLPTRCFQSEIEAVNFLALVQSKINKLWGVPGFSLNRIVKKPNYLIGLICLIPIVGAVAGIIFIANGISKYKDKWFIIIGVSGILFTIFISVLLFYYLNIGKEMRKASIPVAQMQLNTLMKDVEFYKIKNGAYPDSLAQMSKDDPTVWIDDPVQTGWDNGNRIQFNYKKVGNHYYLFSSGVDGIPGTKDDIYPQVAKSDSAKFGLIRKSYRP